MGFHEVLRVKEKSFFCGMQNQDTTTGPENLHVLLVPRTQTNAVMHYITYNSCFLSLRQDLNQFTAVSQKPQKMQFS